MEFMPHLFKHGNFRLAVAIAAIEKKKKKQ